MKRTMPWSDPEDDSSSSDLDSEGDDGVDKGKKKDRSAGKPSEVKSGKRKGAVDFEALLQKGYKGGLSVLNIPLPKEDERQDWSWSTGKEKGETRDEEESYKDRQKTRAAIADGEQLANVQTRKEKNLSFSQKEKRKRELGQASRGKSYVEEEKRLLRDSGVYSGFDT